jgi:ABC-type nitrate/sulfonate/bicarbonate transport system substrate-binding protein
VIASMPRLVAALALVVAAGTAEAADKIKVTIAANDPSYAAYFVAIEKGYFRAEQIDLEMVAAGGGAATPALMSGQVAFSTSSGSAVSAILKGAPLKVVLTMAVALPFNLFATAPEITSLADLKGKPVGVQTRGDLFEVALRAALLKEGLSPDSIIYSPLGIGTAQRLAIMQTGSMPAVILSILDEKVARARGGMARAHLLFDMQRDLEIPYNGLATSDALIAGNPALIRRFLTGVMQGVRYMKRFHAGTFHILQKYNKDAAPDLLDQNLDESTAMVLESGTAPVALQKSEIALRRSMLAMPAEGGPPPEMVFNYSFVQQAVADLDRSGWQPQE